MFLFSALCTVAVYKKILFQNKWFVKNVIFCIFDIFYFFCINTLSKIKNIMNFKKLLRLELDENCLDYHGLLNIKFNNKICRLSGGNIKNIPNDTELIIVLTIDNQIKNLNIERIEIIHYPICDFDVPEINSFKELISNIRHKIIKGCNECSW